MAIERITDGIFDVIPVFLLDRDLYTNKTIKPSPIMIPSVAKGKLNRAMK